MKPTLGFFLLLMMTACATAAPPDTSTPAAATTFDSTTTEAPATTATSTTAAADAAPPELEGTWRTDLGNGDRVALTLRRTSYQISRGGNSGSGAISVEGDTIVFSGSTLCDGVGTYQWSIEGEALTFTAADAGDPCGGRRPVLDGVTYTR
ncbi:MAG TPA: hypothetical protein VGK83_05945 [Acidimicrobiia bacterium]